MNNKKLLIILITTFISFAGQTRDYSCGDFLGAYDRITDQMLMPSERENAKRVISNLLQQREQQFQEQASSEQKEVMDIFINKQRYLKTTFETSLMNQCGRKLDDDFLDIALISDFNFIKPILEHPGFYRCSDINNNVNFEWMSDLGISLLKFDGPLVKNGRVFIYRKSDEEAKISLEQAKTLTAKNCAKYNGNLPLYLSFKEAVFNALEDKRENETKIVELEKAIYRAQNFIPNRDYYEASSQIARNVEKYSSYQLKKRFNVMAAGLHRDIKKDVRFLAESDYQIGSDIFPGLFDESHHLESIVNLQLLFDEIRWQITQLQEKEFKPGFEAAKTDFSALLSLDFINIKKSYLQRVEAETLATRVAEIEKQIIDAGYERHWQTISELSSQINDAIGPVAEKQFNDRSNVMEELVQAQIGQLAQGTQMGAELINSDGILYSAIRSFDYLEGARYLLSDIRNSTDESKRIEMKKQLDAFINSDDPAIKQFYAQRKQQEEELARLQAEKERKRKDNEALLKQLIKEEKVTQGYNLDREKLKYLYKKVKGQVKTEEQAKKFAATINSAAAKVNKDMQAIAIKRYLGDLDEVQALFNQQGKVKSVVYFNDFIAKSEELIRNTDSTFQYEFATGGYDDARDALIDFIEDF